MRGVRAVGYRRSRWAMLTGRIAVYVIVAAKRRSNGHALRLARAFFVQDAAGDSPVSADVLSENPTLSNFKQVFDKIPFARYYANSIVTSVIPTAVSVLTCTMAGMGFASKVPGRDAIFWTILSTMMVPFPATIVPLYVMISKMRLVDTRMGLIVVGLSSASGIFMMRQFIMGIPDELLDAAPHRRRERLRIFRQIVVPLCKPAIATQALFSFTSHWGTYMATHRCQQR